MDKKQEERFVKLIKEKLEKSDCDIASIVGLSAKFGKPAIDAIVDVLKTGWVDERYNASSVLSDIAMLHPEIDMRGVLPDLIRLMEDKDHLHRHCACQTIGFMCDNHPEYDWSGIIPALNARLEDVCEDVRIGSAQDLRDIAKSHPEYDFSGSVLPLMEMLRGGKERAGAAEAIAKIRKAHPEYDFSEAFPLLIKALEDGDGEMRGSAAVALCEFEPRGYADLKMIRKVAEYVKREHPEHMNPVRMRDQDWKWCLENLANLYSDWSAKLNKKAAGALDGKRFPIPKFEKPNKTERVLRVRRSCA